MDHYLDNAHVTERLLAEYRQYGSLVVAYDFDNTVYDYHQKGWQFPRVSNLLRELKEIGCYLIVFTANANTGFVTDYLQQNQIPFDSINENPPFYPSEARKIYYNILLDDRAGLRQCYDVLNELLQTIKHTSA